MSLRFHLVPLLILASGLLIGAISGLRTHADNAVHAEETFAYMAQRAANQIQRRIGSYEYGLRGARGAIIGAGDDRISREIFRRYAQSRDIDREFPGARGFGFIRRVPEAQAADFVRAARAEHWPDFQIKEFQPHQGEHFVIQYIEPVERSMPAVGLDVASEINRRTAALRAMQSGEVAITEPISLIQTPGDARNGFLILLPVYHNGMPLDTEAARTRACFGWVYAPIQIDEVLADFDYREGQFALALHDPATSESLRNFFGSTGYRADFSGLKQEIPIQLGGREWIVEVQATPAFFAALNLTSPWQLGATIAFISLLLALFIAAALRASARRIQHESAAALYRSNERYRTLIEGVREYAILQLDVDGRVTNWNSAAERMNGYTAEEIIGQHFSVFHPQTERQPALFEATLARAVANGKDEEEGWRVRKDGSRYWASVTVAPLYDETGKLLGYSKITRDISQRREREQALSTLSAMHKAILNNAGIAIIATTPDDGLITLFNPSAERLLGYAADEMIGKQTPALFHDPEEVVARAAHLSSELGTPITPGFESFVAKARRGQVDTNEWTYITKIGWRKTVLLSVAGMFDEQRQLLGFVGLAIDLTQQKRHEAELESARYAAERATQAKSEFLANMSHEIRTPMNAILGMMQVVLQGQLQSQQRDYLSKALEASRALLSILNSILDHAKVEAGGLALEDKEMAVETVLANTVALFGLQAEQKGLKLILDMPTSLPGPMRGDPLRLGQVLANLVGNAIKFTDAGEVHLKVEHLGTTVTGSTFRFSVRDTGIGMSEEQRSRIFTPFSQADNSITRRFGGTGLGLSISKALIEMMGGHLEVESQPGVGSTFSFSLTLQSVRNNWERKEALQQAGLHHLLLLEDESPTAEQLRLQLTKWDVNPYRVKTLTEALQTLHAAEYSGHPIDLVLLAGALCASTAPALLSEVTARVGTGRLPAMPHIVLLPASAAEVEALTALKLPIDAILYGHLAATELFNVLLKIKSPALQRVNLRGARILVADDNQLNRKVAQAFLETAGLQVTLVENGQQVLDSLKHREFDAVMLDMHMPEVDGLEAARRIRAEPRFAALPLIAMTAAVHASDRQACLDAGMNDFVGKPLEPEHLLATLAKWIPATEVGLLLSGAGDGVLPAAILQHEALDAATALQRVGGRVTLYLDLLRNFCARTEALSAQLAEAADNATLAERLHQIRGESANLGLLGIAAECLAAENRLAASATARPQEELDRLRDHLRTLGTGLNSLLGEHGRTATEPDARVLTPEENHQVRQLLQELLPLLETHRMQALETADRIRDLLAGKLPARDFAGIHARVHRLEFKEALPVLRGLIERWAEDD
ncbi:MAG: CHASE domain-containing protein [Rhodocyclaceae bacterium]|jgi:PAS domain S-box-containing protein|nr:CHASE domain-containing protein [Rhodocyclaceae bacterium]